jgi:hypothetical protein
MLGPPSARSRGYSVANHICSIRAPFTVTRFVISGGYYPWLIEYVQGGDMSGLAALQVLVAL